MASIEYRLRYLDYLIRQRLSGRFVFIHINKCGGTSVEAALGIPVKIHDTARMRRRKLGRRRWEEAFTFALVRHPYSRLISFYKYRARYNQGGLRDDRPLEINRWIRATLVDRDPAYYYPPRMFAPCFDWISDRSGRIIIDYVAKIETIGEQWLVIQERTGQAAPLPVRNVSGRALGVSVRARGGISRRVGGVIRGGHRRRRLWWSLRTSTTGRWRPR